jgi:adenylate cyclase
LRIDPDCYDAHLCAGYRLIARADWQAARFHFEAAAAQDPSAYRPSGMVIQVYRALGKREDLLAAARRCLRICERLLAVEPDHAGAMGFLVTALAELGEAERAREWTRRAVLFDPDNIRLHYNLACGLAGLGDAEAACDLLDDVIDKVAGSWTRWMQTDNSLDPIRDHPRFVAVMTRAAARTA